MADSQLNIIVKVAGQKEFNDLVQKAKDHNITNGELIRLRKLALNFQRQTIVGSKDEEVANRNLVAAKELVAASSQKVLTANGKMMQSYFRLGTQIRGTLMPMLSSGLPAGFSAVIGGVDMLVNNFERMKTKGVSAAIALKNAFSGGLGIAAGIGLVVAAFAALIKHVNDTKDSLENIKKLNDEILKLEVELGKKSREVLINKQLENIQLLKAKQLKLEAEEATPSLADILTAGSYMQAQGMAQIRQTEEITKLQKEILTLETEVANENKKTTEEKEKQTNELLKQFKIIQPPVISRGDVPIEGTLPKGVTGGSPEFGTTKQRQQWEGQDKFALEQLENTFKVGQMRSQQFTRDLQSGVVQATNLLAQGFVRAFGLGQDLASQLIATLLSAFTSAGLNYLLSFIFPPAGVAAGIAGSARGGGSASMPAVQMAMNTGLGSQRAMQPQFTIINKITPKGLATTVENGNRQNTRSRV